MKNRIRNCGDSDSEIDPFSQWGYYEISPTDMFLEPYHSSINIIKVLVEFVDKYLELLGYPSFVETAKCKGDDFARTLTIFERYHLGF